MSETAAAAADRDREPTSLAEIVRHSSTELLAAYGIVTGSPPSRCLTTMDFAFAGIIGFTGPFLRGTLLVTMSKTTLDRSNPVAESSARDWIAELSNQLLGRIKTELLACGIEIYVSTPAVLRSQHLVVDALRSVDPLELNTETGPVFVWLETETVAEFKLLRQRASALPHHGDSFMF